MVATPGVRSFASDTPATRAKSWEIRDKILPVVAACDYDEFSAWPDGDCRKVFDSTHSADAARHWTGWAMRNTNNHNQTVLKKSCIGLLVCSRRASSGCDVRLRPAICSKARHKQLECRCPREGCDGELRIQRCTGNRGFPVTHFWRSEGATIYFEAKGTHDHPAPDQRWTRNNAPISDNTDASGNRSRTTSQKCRKRNAATPEAAVSKMKKIKPEVTAFDWTGSSADDVTVPEMQWEDLMSSCSVPEVHRQQSMNSSSSPCEQFIMTHPSPEPFPVLSNGTKSKVMASLDFRCWSADWANADDRSTTATTVKDGATVPEVLRWYTTPPPDNPVPVSGESWSLTTTSYPSPDSVGTESGFGVVRGGALCLPPAPQSGDSQWLDKAGSHCWEWETTPTKDSWCWPVDASYYGNKQEVKYLDSSFDDQSLGGVIYESLEGASEYCPLFDSDYFDDVLSVMAKAAANSVPIHAVA